MTPIHTQFKNYANANGSINTEQDNKGQASGDQWAKMAGAMQIRRAGKYKHSLRVVVLAEEQREGGKEMVEVELKPSTLVRKLLLYIICEYIKSSNQAAEVILLTIPGM